MEIVKGVNVEGKEFEVEIERHIPKQVEEQPEDQGEETEDLDEDTSKIEEYDHEGDTYIWDKATNKLYDADDYEAGTPEPIGAMVLKDNGEFLPEFSFGTESEGESSSSEEDSDEEE